MLLDLVDNSVNTFRHVVRALASRTPGPPYTEVSVLLFDLGGCEAFIVSVVPFADFLSEFVGWRTGLVGEEELAG